MVFEWFLVVVDRFLVQEKYKTKSRGAAVGDERDGVISRGEAVGEENVGEARHEVTNI